MSRFTRFSIVAAPALLISFLLTGAGCTAWATYPPVHGAPGVHNPGLAPVPELMAKAIEDVNMQSDAVPSGSDDIDTDGTDRTPVIFNLPPRVDPAVYTRVSRYLPEGSIYMTSPDQIAIHVEAIRIRGTSAEVDVIHDENGVDQMTTVSFKQRLGSGWRVEDRRIWRIRVATPGPRHPNADPASDGSMVEAPTSTTSVDDATVDAEEGDGE